MMYSQRDPSYDRETIGQSQLTIHQYGCFLCSIATLYQVHPLDILDIPNGITKNGLVVSSVIAKALGGTAQKATKSPPDGWSVAMTKHYEKNGYPTHFFVVNPKLKKMIDPLNYPATVTDLTYAISEYRPFTNVRFVLPETEAKEEKLKFSPETILKRLKRAYERVSGQQKETIAKNIERIEKRA